MTQISQQSDTNIQGVRIKKWVTTSSLLFT